MNCASSAAQLAAMASLNSDVVAHASPAGVTHGIPNASKYADSSATVAVSSANTWWTLSSSSNVLYPPIQVALPSW